MKRLIVKGITVTLLVAALAFPLASPAFASGNPGGTGQPGQSCQDQLTSGGTTPGNAANSPGSPFDEPGFGPAPNGGIGGQNYANAGSGGTNPATNPNAVSQYDVACYHLSNPPQ
jgi:hypothetical protein